MSARPTAPPASGAPETLTTAVQLDSTPLAKAPDMRPEIALFAPITKAEMQADGSLLIDTRITSESEDDQGEILDYAASKAAVGDWMAWANVREMHQPSAVGIAVGSASDDVTKTIDGTLRVVDPVAIAKTLAGVYKGVSVGGRRLAVATEKVGDRSVRRVTKWSMSELSLVDRPSNPDATFLLAKRAEADEAAPVADAAAPVAPVATQATAAATGGTVTILGAGQTYVLGESGPETVTPIAKAAADDAMSAAYVVDCLNRLITDEAGEPDDVAILTRARDLVVRFYASENSEVGTEADVAEQAEEETEAAQTADVIAYAAPTGDLAKVTDPSPDLMKAALAADPDFISKVASSVREQLGGIATAADVEATKVALSERLETLTGQLAQVAKRAAPGGPLRYFEQRGTPLTTDSGTSPTDAAEVLRKAAESEPDPVVAEALRKRAAVEMAKVALANPTPIEAR